MRSKTVPGTESGHAARETGARHRAWMWCQAPFFLAIIPLGCDAGRQGESEPPATESFTEQVARVRSGQSSRVETDVPPTAAEWESVSGLEGLRTFILRAGVATDAEAAILATLPDIERLVLRESPLSDEGFRRLATLRTLRDLNVPRAACTAAGVRALAGLPALECLRLGGPHLAGTEVAPAVAELTRLRSLHLIDVAIGDAGLEALAGLSGLRNLYLDGAGVSDEAWGRYFEVRPGTHVHVDQAHHDRDPGRHEHPRRSGTD